ncbi:MAG: xanthine dehydrogenase family protein molybdopterin-binding subunit [Candidatus Schekmanbacteria bacterium]|nr:MAG: xanthine dehydrogenase family protein molybdopterin-binding subunit [Candidatus Schekmanbacteria bacterium]
MIGKAIPRIESKDKARGKAVYTGDVVLPQKILVGKILYSQVPHGIIKNIDYSEALKVPGVKAVITSEDFKVKRTGLIMEDEMILATGKVRFIGEKIAAVAAVNEEAANEALSKIKVEIEELPHLSDPLKALETDSILVHDDLIKEGLAESMGIEGNLCSSMELCQGDIEKGFEEADVVIEDTFKTSKVHHCFIEPHVSLALWHPEKGFNVWTSTQGYFFIQQKLAAIFSLPITKVKVMPVESGGAFGGKVSLCVEPLVCALSMKAGQPVRITVGRDEEFLYGKPRFPATTKIKLGVKKDGSITALHSQIYYDLGAYSDFGPIMMYAATNNACGPYKIPNAKLEGYAVYTNKISGTSFRAPGVPQYCFALESMINRAASKLGMDSIEIRKKNAVTNGYVRVSGEPINGNSFLTVLDKAKELLDKNPKRDEVGIAACIWETRAGPSSILLRLSDDGRILIITGVCDLTGARTIFVQIVCDVFSVEPDDVEIIYQDSSTAPVTPPSTGSGTIYNVGHVVKSAAESLKSEIIKIAMERLECSDESEIEISAKKAVKKGTDKSVSFAEISKYSRHKLGKVLMKEASSVAEYNATLFGLQMAEVDVDTETGKVDVKKITAIHDVGKIMNPLLLKGQVEGAILQGTGFAVLEEIVFNDVKALTDNFSDYAVPTIKDVPEKEIIILEGDYSKDGPYGSKGIGEPPVVPTAPAIADAVFKKTGVAISELPLSPERVFKALKEKSS